MKLFSFRLLVPTLWILLLCGCADSAKQTENRSVGSPPSATVTATDARAPETVSEEPAADAAGASSTDAASILASTVKAAKAGDKRVMVHLGAPW